MAEQEGGTPAEGAGPTAGSASPVENPDLIALGTVLSGLATAVAGGSIAHATYLREAGNYAVSSVLAETLAPLTLFGALFLLGCYLGASSFWLAARRVVDIVPLRVAMGALAAGALAFVALSFLGAVVPRPLVASFSLLAAFYGARLTTSLRRQKPADARLRLGRVGLTAMALLTAVILLTHRAHGFPGPAAPAAERDAWAQKTFKEHYAEVTSRVKGCSGVAAHVGAVRSVAPTSGRNTVFYGAEDAKGAFTLEVIGEKGTAHLAATTVQPYDAKGWRVDLAREEAGQTVPVECR